MIKGYQKLLLLFVFLSATHLYANNESEISGNIRVESAPKEFGLVSSDNSLKIPPAYAPTGENYKYTIDVAYTLWVAYQEGLTVAFSNSPTTAVGNLPPGNSIRPPAPARSGFKVMAFMQLHYDDWATGIEYTWFNNQNKLSTRNFNIDNAYKTTWTTQSTIDLSEIASSFSNQFNRLNLKLLRQVEFGPSFVLSPWISIAGAWEDQDFNADMELQKTVNDIDFFQMRNTQYWYAVGPSAGSKILVPITKHFSCFLDSGAALTFAKHSVRQNQRESETSTSDKVVILNIFDD